MKPNAFILTNGMLMTPNAKTAHGLIRGTERFEITGVLDQNEAGNDAGVLLDGKHRNIPVFENLDEALAASPETSHLIIGIATHGGVLPADMLLLLEEAIQRKLHIVNGLHDYLSERPHLKSLADAHGVQLLDIRKPKHRSQMHFWSGEIYEVQCPIIAVLGMDCAMGKRTTARLLTEACRKAGLQAHMIYTGQTGWLQGGSYGFIFDSTLNDFVSGEVEHAIVSCWKETKPDVIFIEGQSALRNPSGPCGSEFIISGNARHVVLLHAPKRTWFDQEPHWGAIPDVPSEITLINALGATVIGLGIHTEDCTQEEALRYQAAYQEQLGIPVLLPIQQGVEALLPVIQQLIP